MGKPWTLVLLLLKLFAVAKSFRGPRNYQRRAPLSSNGLFVSASTDREVSRDTLAEDYDTIIHLSETALLNPGQPSCLRALETLSQLCRQRKPYRFSKQLNQCRDGSLLEKIEGLIPTETTERIFQIVTGMQKNGWLSTNPDSVDGLPSFHLNLISSGKKIVDDEPSKTGDTVPSFEHDVEALIRLVSPYVYEHLLPLVQQRLATKDIQISDVFLRRYGNDIIDGQSRHGISAHYDVFSRATCVIALDDTAKDGRNGLFTTQESCRSDRTCSNHRSLRRFFPLSCGDAVLHTWDVLHGVDVEPGVDRTSLIVWFTSEENTENQSAVPWLTNRYDLETNHVAQFVLASSLESSEDYLSGAEARELYLQSATRGNLFAMTRLGSLCEEDELAGDEQDRIRMLLTALEKGHNALPDQFLSNERDSNLDLAKRLWWQGSLRGNPIAQVALADELMATAMSQECVDVENYLETASVLFALAAQQGNDHAIQSLHRIQALEAALREMDNPPELNLLVTRSIQKSALVASIK